MAAKHRITIIGGGVGGYPAAIRAARMGAAVTLIEKAEMGGNCLNWGCIPTKSLLHSTEIARLVTKSEVFGINTGPPEVDFTAVMNRKDQVVAQLRRCLEILVASKKITVIKGTATLAAPHTVRIVETGKQVETDSLIIATGSVPAIPPIPELVQAGSWDSNDFLAMEQLPASAAVIGGGVVGVELAQVMAGLGSKVTILELMPQLVPGLDQEVAKALEGALTQQGITVVTEARVTGAAAAGSERVVSYEAAGASHDVKVQRVLVAVGRAPVTDGLEADKLGLQLNNQAVKVNKRMETNLPGVYATGDVTGGAMLAHVAIAESECAAVNAMGGDCMMDYKAVPACIYSFPEVASVGLSEEEALNSHEIEVGRFPFSACSKAVVIDETYGMVKIVAEKKHGEVLGVHIIGPHATDIIAEALIGMSLEITVEELAHAIHSHPTVSEAVMEAAMCLRGGSVHMR